MPKDFPHGLPLPRPIFSSSSQPTSPAVQKTPIPLPTRSPTRPTTVPTPFAPPRPPAIPHSTDRPRPANPTATYAHPPPPVTSALPPRPAAPSVAIQDRAVPRPTSSSAPPSRPSGPHPIPPTSSVKPLKHPPWSEEEDSLIIYLKHGLEWSFREITPLLTGRSQGAANTRYCNRLKYGYDIERAIGILQRSRWAHVLRPERHTDILAREVPPAPAFADHFGFDDGPTFTGHPSTAGVSIASQRERRAAQRPTNYYSRDHYANEFDEDIVAVEPEKITEPHQSAFNSELAGTEVKGVSRRSTRLLKTGKQYRSYKPYLSYYQRLALRHGFDEGEWKALNDWQGTKVHHPFTEDELKSLKLAITLHFDQTSESDLYDLTEPEILEMASYARSFLPTRTKESIEAFLRDAADNCVSKEALRLTPHAREPSISAVLRNRELGMRTIRRDYSKCSVIHLQTPAFATMGPSVSFTGTSGDVNTVAWAPNGTQFAAGSACLVDSDSMQYNRPNNLLFGDVPRRTLQELPDHVTKRKLAEAGVNSSRSMHATQDPWLFQTVSMIAFSPDGDLMYSAGYDCKVRIYDVTRNGIPEKSDVALRHKAPVDLLSVSAQGLLATGCQRSKKNSIKVVDPYEAIEHCDEDFNPVMCNFSSRKAAERPENGIFPSALRFDPSGDYLLAGFASTSREEMTSGETCLWDVRTGEQLSISPETRNVFDVAWNPNCWQRPLFAVGCVAGVNVNRGVRSVIKMYDLRTHGKYGLSMELDCPALDMNDVMFSPYDENIIVAGCTNGKTYVWDLRQPQPEDHLYSLVHGEPLMELGDGDAESRERLDTGIRFCSWGSDRRNFYTGSSDGVVKVWDPYRAPEDVFVKDVIELNSGIMSGAFSPDYTSLLLGEVNGTINVLEVGQSDRSIKDADPMALVASEKRPVFDDEETGRQIKTGHQSQYEGQHEGETNDSGIATARRLLRTGQMTLRPIGSLPIRQAVQGPNYAGPWDRAEDADHLRKASLNLQRRFSSPPTTHCDIPACRDAAANKKLVPEEAGDSGRSVDRIPEKLRSLGREREKEGSNRKMVVAPTLKCSSCHVRPARPRADGDNDNAESESLCERCGFSCFRCGDSAEVVDVRVEEVVCSSCGLRWRADILGYKLLSGSPTSSGGGKTMKRETARERDRRRGHDYLAGEGEECVEEYFHGLWQDRPPSPL